MILISIIIITQGLIMNSKNLNILIIIIKCIFEILIIF